MTEGRARVRGLLARPDFRRLFGVRLVGQFSDGLLQAALATFVLFSPERQPTALAVAVAFAILYLPFSFVGPFAGVFLDRWRRRQVLVRANLIKAALAVVLVWMAIDRQDGASLALTVLVCLGVGRFVLAGLSASLPHVVEGNQLVTANALTPTAGTIAAAVGALVGVGIRSVAGGGDYGSAVVLACTALGYALAGLLALAIARDRLGPDDTDVTSTVMGVLRGFGEGVRELVAQPIAGRSILVVTMHRVALGALTVGALLLFRNTFNPGEPDTALRDFATVTAFAAAGALIGAVITPALTRRISAVAWSVIVMLQASVVVSAGVLSLEYAGLFAAAFSLGFAGQCVKVCADTLTQRCIPDDRLGRAFSLFDMLVNVGLVAGIAAMALTSPASGQATVTFLGVGVLLAGTALWYAVISRPRQ